MREFGTVAYGEYRIASLAFSSEEKAKQVRRIYWRGVPDVRIWYDPNSDSWYIVAK